jgi:hypothetical protein
MQFLYGWNELIGIVLLKFVHVYHDTGKLKFYAVDAIGTRRA